MRTLLRLLVGLTFLIAGGIKIYDPLAFFSGLLNYRVPFPPIFLRVTAGGLPWLEVFTGLGLIFNIWPETIRPVTCVLTLTFVLMLGQALMRGLDLNCSCFGSGNGGEWFERPGVALVRATLLFAASLYIAAAPASPSAKGSGTNDLY